MELIVAKVRHSTSDTRKRKMVSVSSNSSHRLTTASRFKLHQPVGWILQQLLGGLIVTLLISCTKLLVQLRQALLW
jgi:hypothetical protein